MIDDIAIMINQVETIEFSEDDLALRFAGRHVDKFRYVPKWNRWMFWDEKRWSEDERMRAFSLAREVGREASLQKQAASKNKQSAKNLASAMNLASAKTRAAIIKLASSDARLVATVDQWDKDPWLLNTPGGIIDLRTGKVSTHRQDRYMTQITSVAADDECPTPLWTDFLKRVTGDDQDYIDFLQRIGGYTLTGSTREEALFFFHGPGGNGKGVFVSTLAGIMGDYFRPAEMTLFIAINHPQHSTNMAGLHKARMISVPELEDNAPWAEARIKAMTGEDKMTARFMRGDNFDFHPQFKPWVSGNIKPNLRSVDEAMKRRMNLIPFRVVIPKSERDKELKDKLKAEWPGILNWFVKGCLEWQRVGLKQPDIVVEATNEYFAGEDTLQIFLDDCCEIGQAMFEPSANVFFRWSQFMEARGEKPGSQKALTQKLKNRGFDPTRDIIAGKRSRCITGLKLLDGVPPADLPKDDSWQKEQAM